MSDALVRGVGFVRRRCELCLVLSGFVVALVLATAFPPNRLAAMITASRKVIKGKAMQIAVSSQNRKAITEHAGKCRKFWIYKIDKGEISDKRLLELPVEQTLHASNQQLPGPLAAINVLISGSIGAGLHHRLMQAGIQPIITTEGTPDMAVAAYLEGRLDRLPIDHRHQCHGHGHRLSCGTDRR